MILYSWKIGRKSPALNSTESIVLRKIVDNMNESILVIDRFNQIKDFNPAFLETFKGYREIKIGDSADFLADHLETLIDNNSESLRMVQAIADKKAIQTSGSIDLIKPNKRCLLINIKPIFSDKYKELLGRILTFTDITPAKNLWNELNTTNTQLSMKNQQLKQYADMVGELAVAKERNRFAKDVHDTLGQTMTLLITLLQITKIKCQNDPENVESQLDKALKIASDGLAEVRCSLLDMAFEDNISIKESLKSLIDHFQMSGMKIELSIGELGKYDDFSHTGVIYRICQEALTNALRHGKADHVRITIEFDDQWMYMAITDDGSGCEKFKKGFGLNGMEQRISNLKGDIIFNHGKAGFSIFVMIPLI
jgi:signal transduction histidine kinase